MGGRLLQIDATAITFVCEVKKQSTSSVHLFNIYDQYVAYKVKTTSPKRFCVRPNSGIISPKSACDFTVTMQGLRSPPSEVDCKDKFLIQSTVVDAGTKEEEVTLELFAKGSGKYIEEKKLRVVLVGKEDSPSEEHKNKVLEKEPSNESSAKEENVVAHKALDNESSVKKEDVVKHEVLEKESSNESSVKKEDVVQHEVLEKESSNESSVKKEDVVQHEVLEKEPSNESSVKKEDVVKHKVLEKEPSNESSTKEENVVENKVLEKEPSKEENVVKKDENTLPSPAKTDNNREVKGGLTTEDPKASGDHDGNEGTLLENSKPDPVKVVKEDPERKLRLFNLLKELKLKEAALENQLKEAKSTISSLTCQNSFIIEAKETLKLELARRSKKGYPFVFVCIVLIIGLISGYISDP
ncbi:uncharacterized protein LOC143564497 [Bidens hawaiensis]|uniref:uncharacterized protein LOC143564497 n=1 Tax=Bidens hawaiensis TaxID=980011 RepID=UPI00404B5291